MEETFWQERWREGRIGFHEAKANRLLEAHFPALGLTAGNTVFVPLCGKSLDLDWLLGQGLRVVGIEFSEEAVKEVFTRLGLDPVVQDVGGLKRYENGDLVIFVGDIFALTRDLLGPVAAVYDRAAVVAMAPEDRARYAAHTSDLSGTAQQLVITFDYDQSRMSGPPFAVNADYVADLYGKPYGINRLERSDIKGPMGERTGGGAEEVWLITARTDD
ncbi:thiopurine S-methyltransferase [Falsiphaeobacter marinintestinus]|uniref:thiopurine S-methyltransferase n=1 Tax=Falsiphaeobacter marinintestinus TaxID=1492905 RepID=UPI0011B648E3|nr:thiopurine S-methyltransferase [Phaeobacter marinintestinus]